MDTTNEFSLLAATSDSSSLEQSDTCSTEGGNTESELLSSRNSSVTIDSGGTHGGDETGCCHWWQKIRAPCMLVTGLILTTFGVLTIIWSPFYVLMNERLNMVPGLPPFDWWQNPPDEVLLRVYIFNITNAEEFLNGTHPKLHLQEIGPIIYREKLTHTNVTFNPNGTLTYTAKRTAIYLPEMNTVDLNQTITTLNLAVLGAASFLHDASFFTKFAFNMLIRTTKATPIVTTTIYDYMWNLTNPMIEMGSSVMPSLVPVNNLGILHRIYEDFEDRVTVYIGRKHGHEKFFLLDKYHGMDSLPGHGDSCQDGIVNATEGVLYAQFLTKNSTLRYWRKTMCKVTPLLFERETIKYGVDAFKFTLPANIYDRTDNSTHDCYSGNPVLPDGLSDVSPCYFGFPMAASFPHFLYGDDVIRSYVDGLQGNVEKHESFVTVEPLTGIPMESWARSQSNLIIRQLNGFNKKLSLFSNLVFPMFWAEYTQVGLPFCVIAMMYMTVKVLPILQWCITIGLIVQGAFLVLKGLGVTFRTKRHFVKNTVLHFEQEFFLKQS